MKTLFQTLLKFALVSALLAIGGVSATAQTAKLQLDQLDVLANRASETVDVKLDEHLMQTTASFTFEKESEYSPAEVESVMTQLRGGGWSKIIGVTSKKDGDNVDVYLMSVGDEISGLAVVSLEPKELTIVNIVGPINLEKLTQLEGSFGVPYLNLPPPKPKSDK